jgi:hypothetical protein
MQRRQLAALQLNYLPVVKTKASDEDGSRTVQSQVDMACGRSYSTNKGHTLISCQTMLCLPAYSTLNRRHYCIVYSQQKLNVRYRYCTRNVRWLTYFFYKNIEGYPPSPHRNNFVLQNANGRLTASLF